jgi:hypothetical protein
MARKAVPAEQPDEESNTAPEADTTQEDAEDNRPIPSANPLNVVSMTRYKPKAQAYLWDGMIPLNLYTVMSGEGGSGKTTLLVHLLSKATVGELEGQYLGTPINVLYCTTENDPSTALAPKLYAAGADTDRFMILGKADRFRLPDDLPLLVATIKANDIKVLVLDPLVDFIDQDRSVNNYGYVNDVMADIITKMGELGVTLIGIMHKGKAQKKTNTDSVVGSVAFTTKARCVIMVGKTQKGLGIAGTIKVNQGTPYTGWVFSVERRPIGRDKALGLMIEADFVELVTPAQKSEVKAMFAEVIDVAADARVQRLLVYVQRCGVVDTGTAQHILMKEFKIRDRMARTTIGEAVAARLIHREHNGGKGGDSAYKLSLTVAGERLLAESDDMPDEDDPENFEQLPDDTFEAFDDGDGGTTTG